MVGRNETVRFQTVSSDSTPCFFEAAAGPAGEALCRAAATLARLDERLTAVPRPIRTGWLNRMLLEEAAASARLDGIAADADELRLHAAGALAFDDGQAAHSRLELAAGVLRVLQAVTARHPRQLFTVRRLTAAARLRFKGRPHDIRADPRLPAFLVEIPDPGTARTALARALSPEAMAAGRRMAPPLAAAGFLARWSGSGCAQAIGGHIGRALISPLFIRLGAARHPVLFPAVGYRGHGHMYRPDRLGRENEVNMAWLDACQRSAALGLRLLDQVTEAHARLHAALRPARSTGHGGRIADLLTETPAVSGAMAAERTGLSETASRAMLQRAHRAGALHELTGRTAFRLYGALP